MPNSISTRFIAHPKRLFLIDGLGALLTILLFLFVLIPFENFFGIPRSVVYFLAVFPTLFLLYDMLCYTKVHNRFSRYLRGIASANCMYCGLSLGTAIYHNHLIRPFGWFYILAEIIIILLLASIEYKTANALD